MHKLMTPLNTCIKITNNHQEGNVRKKIGRKEEIGKKEVVYPESVSVKSLRRSVVWRNSPGRIGGLNPLRATSQRRASLQPLRRTSRSAPLSHSSATEFSVWQTGREGIYFPCRKSSSLVSRVLFNDRRWVTLVSVTAPHPARRAATPCVSDS